MTLFSDFKDDLKNLTYSLLDLCYVYLNVKQP